MFRGRKCISTTTTSVPISGSCGVIPIAPRWTCRDGNVQVSRCYPGGVSTEDVWTPLPSMRTDVTVGADGGDFFYTTFIDYEWTVQTVNIFVTTSDLYTEDVPGDMSFRVIITR